MSRQKRAAGDDALEPLAKLLGESWRVPRMSSGDTISNCLGELGEIRE